MAILAQDFVGQVPAFQRDAGLLSMIKIARVEFDQMRIAPHMLLMAFPARLLVIMLAVQTVPADEVSRHLLVATLAQTGLGGLVKTPVAIFAIVTELGVNLCHSPRRQHIWLRICAG